MPLPQELRPYQSLFFELLVAGDQKASWASLSPQLRPLRHLEAPLPGVLLCCSACQAHRGATLAGVLLCGWGHQALQRAPWVGSCSVDWHIRHIEGHPGWGPTLWFSGQAFDGPASLFSCRCWRVGGKRLW